MADSASNEENLNLRIVSFHIVAKNAVSLDDDLNKMSSSERSSVLAANQFGDLGNPPLVYAVEAGSLDIVNVLLKYKADVEVGGKCQRLTRDLSGIYDTDIYRDGSKWFFSSCCTPLFLAAAYGHLDILRCLVENGADINACSEGYCTPLMIAIKMGHINVATFLTEHGANVNLKDDGGCLALHHAMYLYHHSDSLEICSCLIKHGADVNSFNHGKRFRSGSTPLMIAIEMGHINVANVLVEHGAKVDLKDVGGCTALHHAMYLYHHHSDSLEICSWLIKHGADVNGCYNYKSPPEGLTPLMIAIRDGQLGTMTLLIKHGADVNVQDEEGKTALHYAIERCDVSCEVLSCLIKNGANVNAYSNDGYTPLMKAIIRNQLIHVVTYLIEDGANVDLQDKNGNTALHHAVLCETNFCDLIDHLVTGGASHIRNNQGLTPLLLASNRGKFAVVEYLNKRPEITKEQRINALELLGASLVILDAGFGRSYEKGLKYIKRGMGERFSNVSEPLLKQSMAPVEAYQNRTECQSLEELAQIEGYLDTMIIESIVIRERIIGNESESLRYVTAAAGCYFHANRNFSTCLALYRHAVKIAQSSKQSADFQLDNMSRLLHEEFKRSGLPKVKNHLIELFELILLDYETQRNVKKPNSLSRLFDISVKVVLFISKVEFHGESKRSNLSTLLKQLFRKDPQDRSGNTLLHKVIECHMDNEVYSCLDAVKLLLSAGFNVNAKNKKGNTPLHIAANFKPRSGKICFVAEILQVLIDGGAHHDFVNNDGRTPMEMAKTDEARMTLSESRNLELRCISARAVRMFGIPYLGVVPKTLEKYINMHSS